MSKLKGQEGIIIERYMDTPMTEKDKFESKQLRHYLGIGMIEARALLKRH